MIKFLLRQGDEADRPAIRALMARHLMEADLPPQEFLLVEIDEQLAGLARLEVEGQAIYLRPIVVDSSRQGRGIGRRLVQEITLGLPAVDVIARGAAAGFYSKLGFVPMSWEQVPERYLQECASCPDRKQCQPLPMHLEINADRKDQNIAVEEEA